MRTHPCSQYTTLTNLSMSISDTETFEGEFLSAAGNFDFEAINEFCSTPPDGLTEETVRIRPALKNTIEAVLQRIAAQSYVPWHRHQRKDRAVNMLQLLLRSEKGR